MREKDIVRGDQNEGKREKERKIERKRARETQKDIEKGRVKESREMRVIKTV